MRHSEAKFNQTTGRGRHKAEAMGRASATLPPCLRFR